MNQTETIPTWKDQYVAELSIGLTKDELLEKLEFEKELKLVETFANAIDIDTSITNIDGLEETIKAAIHYEERHAYLCDLQSNNQKRLR